VSKRLCILPFTHGCIPRRRRIEYGVVFKPRVIYHFSCTSYTVGFANEEKLRHLLFSRSLISPDSVSALSECTEIADCGSLGYSQRLERICRLHLLL
jgi:hypothetical protein